MGPIRLVLGYLVIWGNRLESRISREVIPHMEWSLVHVLPPNYPNKILLGWSPPLTAFAHVFAHVFAHGLIALS